MAYKMQEKSTSINMPNLADIYQAMHLPMPEEGEHSPLRLGTLVGLNDYGAVLRIERAAQDQSSAGAVDSPLALKPLLQFETYIGEYKMNIELCPGVHRVGISPVDHKILKHAFAAQGQDMAGGWEDDCGYLPYITEKYRFGLPILVDRSDVTHDRLLQNIEETPESRNLRDLCQSVQEDLYGALSALAHDMVYDIKRESRNEDKARAFWQSMHEATKRTAPGNDIPVLSAAWNNTSRKTVYQKTREKKQEIAKTAAHYARHIRRDPFHACILAT